MHDRPQPSIPILNDPCIMYDQSPCCVPSPTCCVPRLPSELTPPPPRNACLAPCKSRQAHASAAPALLHPQLQQRGRSRAAAQAGAALARQAALSAARSERMLDRKVRRLR
jgi:hypothetical protein